MPKDKIYLDYGCGKWNSHINILNADGYNMYGYDEYCIKKDKYILNDLENKTFDVIMSNNFIEHVIHPYEDLSLLKTHLNPNGKLIFMTSCFEYSYEFTHYHTFFFIGKSLDILASQLDMKIEFKHKYTFPNNIFSIIVILSPIF